MRKNIKGSLGDQGSEDARVWFPARMASRVSSRHGWKSLKFWETGLETVPGESLAWMPRDRMELRKRSPVPVSSQGINSRKGRGDGCPERPERKPFEMFWP